MEKKIGNESPVFVLMAGGEGARLGPKVLPKPLTTIVDKPIINFLIEKIFQTNNLSKIFIIIKNKFVDIFKTWEMNFTAKEMSFYREINKIEVLSEETHFKNVINELKYNNWKLKGTLPATYGLMEYLKKSNYPNINNEILYIINADNYFEDGLNNFINNAVKSLNNNNICMNMAYRLDNYTDASKYGVINSDNVQKGVISGFKEKPINPSPKDRLISVGCYALKNNDITNKLIYDFLTKNPGSAERQRRNKYEENLAKNSKSKNELFVDIGHLFTDLYEKKKKTILYDEIKGPWFDIGNRKDLLSCIKHCIEQHLDPVTKLSQIIGKSHKETDDKYYIPISPKAFEIDKKQNTLIITLWPDDKVSMSKLTASNNAKNNEKDNQIEMHSNEFLKWKQHFSQILNKENKVCCGNCNSLEEIGDNVKGHLYLSGGVVLIDCLQNSIEWGDKNAGIPDYFKKHSCRIPLQRRDFEANVDPDKLTMPAGNLDNLPLKKCMTKCCYTEMAEEFIFYGKENEVRYIYYLTPPEQHIDMHAFLDRIFRNRIEIPGIERNDIKRALNNPDSIKDLVKPLHVNEYNLDRLMETPNVWNVTIKYKGEDGDLIIEKDWFLLVLDEKTDSLEFRKIAWANICDVEMNPVYGYIKDDSYFGKIAGLADGEGFGRIPLLFDAGSLFSFFTRLDNKKEKWELLDDECEILACGSPGTGRFNRFNFKVPSGTLLSTTLSVKTSIHFLSTITCD
jgi:NDP-sugar pyrophosphorylase family protein